MIYVACLLLLLLRQWFVLVYPNLHMQKEVNYEAEILPKALNAVSNKCVWLVNYQTFVMQLENQLLFFFLHEALKVISHGVSEKETSNSINLLIENALFWDEPPLQLSYILGPHNWTVMPVDERWQFINNKAPAVPETRKPGSSGPWHTAYYRKQCKWK